MKTPMILALGTALVLGVATTAAAQETMAPGAERVEVGLTPVGGTFFNVGSDTSADFGNYALGLNATYNANRWVGLEGEVGAGIGVKQTIDYQGTPLADVTSPHSLAYNLNLAIYPAGSDHAFVPYLTAGGGGMTLFSRDELATVGLNDTQTFGSENVGAGLKWWSADDWGLRADYRFIIVNGRDNVDPFFGLNENEYGHRVSGSFLYTFGGA